MIEPLTLQEIQAAATKLAGRVVRTPVHRLRSAELDEALGVETELHLKLELLQLTGTFKARAALLNVLALSAGAHSRGVTAISAGNHAIAVAFAAAAAGVSAKVVMIATANPLRVALCRSYGAEIVFAPDAHAGFATVERIAAEEGRTFIHPFDNHNFIAGHGTMGLEIVEQLPTVRTVIAAIGGGGLITGVGSGVKALRPDVKIIGAEPETAAPYA
jgi:threonine dehydratase